MSDRADAVVTAPDMMTGLNAFSRDGGRTWSELAQAPYSELIIVSRINRKFSTTGAESLQTTKTP